MSADTELELLRKQVGCAAVLEQSGQGWQVDKAESTKRAIKYRAGHGRIVIVNHGGRGWWDATSSAKGDVFSLVQFLQPGLNFGDVRKKLRALVGVEATYPQISHRPNAASEPHRTPADRWKARPRLRRCDPAWRYLQDTRLIPTTVLSHAGACDAVRNGAYDSAWFAHRDLGAVTHVEVRGSSYKGSLRAGRKTLFRFAWTASRQRRLAIVEAPIDALSLAALEAGRDDTLYVATGGGIGPGTLEVLQRECADIRLRRGVVAIATDANDAGDRFAGRLAQIAVAQGAQHERLRPDGGADWNDILRQDRGDVP